ncbi:unnamed protein product [Linum tenue]|uniref:Uncharacterized protein n=1 Tax=Linum tenue TaxID=586396 RepID=A0AAV0MAA9_9ROSI|nr:unnamed protein product [Linum tenue]
MRSRPNGERSAEGVGAQGRGQEARRKGHRDLCLIEI